MRAHPARTRATAEVAVATRGLCSDLRRGQRQLWWVDAALANPRRPWFGARYGRLWRLVSALISDTSRRASRRLGRQVTMMRHLFSLFVTPGAILLLTYLVLDAPFLFVLTPQRRRPPLLHARQRRTRAAVPIAAVAPPADHCLTLTSLAVKKAAVWDAHPQAPTKGFTGRRGKAMLSTGASTGLPAITQGVRGDVLDPHLRKRSHCYLTALPDGATPRGRGKPASRAPARSPERRTLIVRLNGC